LAKEEAGRAVSRGNRSHERHATRPTAVAPTHRLHFEPHKIMNIVQQAENLPGLRNAKDILLATFRDDIVAGREVIYEEFSRVVEGCFSLGYDWQRAKPYIVTLWYLFKDELRPLYKLINPDKSAAEVEEFFCEARGLLPRWKR
jgi:hypothetical protein